jgi:hypothetical protein
MSERRTLISVLKEIWSTQGINAGRFSDDEALQLARGEQHAARVAPDELNESDSRTSK